MNRKKAYRELHFTKPKTNVNTKTRRQQIRQDAQGEYGGSHPAIGGQVFGITILLKSNSYAPTPPHA